MKKRASIAGCVSVFAVALTLMGCSHNRSQEKSKEQVQQQPGQAQQTQSKGASQAQPSGAQSQSQTLGEQNVTPGTAQIQRQKKVISTVIIKEKIPTVKEQTVRADINRMNSKQFTALGFPSDVAVNIVEYRDRNGQFHSVDELANVDGVSQSMLNKFDGSLGVGQSAAGQAAPGQEAPGLGAQDQSGAGISGQSSDSNVSQ